MPTTQSFIQASQITCNAEFSNINQAKEAGSRKKKIALIESTNPDWKDLFEEYHGNVTVSGSEAVS